jgi:hypothetical protein
MLISLGEIGLPGFPGQKGDGGFPGQVRINELRLKFKK